MANVKKKPWFIRWAKKCKSEGKYKVVLDRQDKEPYLERFYIHPRWLTLGLFRIVIHRFWKSDDPKENLHDHPWLFAGTRILKGGYYEHTLKGINHRKTGNMALFHGWRGHRVELEKKKDGTEKEVWTLFLMGPKIKEWGFSLDEKTWIRWDIHLASRKKRIEEEVKILKPKKIIKPRR